MKTLIYQMANRWLALAGCLAVNFFVVTIFYGIDGSAQAQNNTWSGGGASTNWNDAANWGGTSIVSGNSAIFSGTSKKTNVNDIVGLSLKNVTFSSANWNLGGNALSLTGVISNNNAGINIMGMDINVSSASSGNGNIYQNNVGDILKFTGIISGSGSLNNIAGGNGQGQIYLVNTNNSFTGQAAIRSGKMFFYSLAPGGQNSSLGADTNAIWVGDPNTSYAAALTYLGTSDGFTDRGMQFNNNNTGVPAFTNASPNNANLTFSNNISFKDGTVNLFTTYLASTSKTTNMFMGVIGPTDFTTTWAGSLNIYGQGTWIFNNLINVAGNLSVFPNTSVILKYTNNPFVSDTLFSNITLNAGSYLDVSSFDANNAVFTIGYYKPQILTAGHISGSNTDINGSLSLGGNAGATLNEAGTGTAGTLTISSNFIPASGAINFDLNNTNTVGSGSNDLILVKGNLDLSQGTAQINVRLLHGSLMTNTAYTLFAYSGSLIGDASGLRVPSPNIAYLDGVVDTTSSPGLVLVTFPSSGLSEANLIWQGNVNNNWDINTSQNWLNGSTPAYFANGNNFTFNDTSVQSAVNLVGSLVSSTITISNVVKNYVFSGTGSIDGGALVKQGVGSLVMATANSYNGGTTVSAGALIISNSLALGSGGIILGDANSGNKAVLLEADTAVTNSINVSSGGTNTVTLASAGALTLNAPITLNKNLTIDCYNTTPNSLTLQGGITGTGNITVVGGVKLQNATGFLSPFNFNGNINLTTDTNGNSSYLGFNQTAASVNTNISVNMASNTVLGVVSSPPINALNGNGQVIAGIGIGAGASYYVPSLIIGSGNASGTFGGIITTNPTGFSVYLVKNGTGTETFTGDFTGSTTGSPTNSGGTTINNGVLAINNATGTGLTSLGVYVATAGTLAGNGSIDESTNGVTLYGKLSVGNAGDTTGKSFTIVGSGTTGALRINAGSSLLVDLFSGAGGGDNTANTNAADFLNAQTQVIITNASLVVSNPNTMSAWSVGDKWKIINWGSTVTGVFTNLNLPALPSNLAWDTSALYTTGVIGIIAPVLPTAPASITGITLVGSNLVLIGTNMNGGAGFHYVVLTTTNLATPLTNWTILSTNAFNADGSFRYTNALNSAQPAAFFSTKAMQ